MKNYRAVSADEAELLQEVESKNFGPVCGMTLNNFYKTKWTMWQVIREKATTSCTLFIR